MDLGPGRRRGGGGVRTSVVAGSVWESRMKSDEVRGGIKVLAEQEEENGGDKDSGKRSNWKKGGGKTEIGGVAVSGKRKTWKSEGIEKNRIENAKGKIDSPSPTKPPISAVSVDGNRRSPVSVKKVRSEISKSVDGIEKSVDGIEKSPIRARNLRSESDISRSADFSKESVESGEAIRAVDRNSALDETESGENCKEFGVCEEKAVSRSENEDEDEDEDEEFYDDEEEDEEEIEMEIEKKRIQIKEMNVPEQKPKPVSSEFKKFNQFNRNSPFPPIVHKQSPPVMKRATPVSPNPAPKSTHSPENPQRNFPHTHNKLQNLVDLVMWRDVAKSAFAFGLGTFIIISSSYTKDINISFISVVSYLGLAYLAAIFIYRSIICRGVVVEIDERSVLGEEEAIWLLKLFLPYLNELVLQLKALFSGDPATTMKLAVLLFVLARCGNSITIWKMAKLGFFGVFTVPKVCCSYSRQLTAYGKFWIRRFQDAWDSCTHKKAVAIGIFTVFWNFSSIVARIWAAFMLFVALRYYQYTLVSEGWVEENTMDVGVSSEETLQRPTGNPRGPRQGLRRTVVGANLPNKLKKGF